MRTERDIKNQIAYAKKEGQEETLRQMADQLRELGISEKNIEAAIHAVRDKNESASSIETK